MPFVRLATKKFKDSRPQYIGTILPDINGGGKDSDPTDFSWPNIVAAAVVKRRWGATDYYFIDQIITYIDIGACNRQSRRPRKASLRKQKLYIPYFTVRNVIRHKLNENYNRGNVFTYG